MNSINPINPLKFAPIYNFIYTNNVKVKSISLKENERKALHSLKNILSDKFDLLDFRIYGSKARGDATDESDIDVMIILYKVNSDIRSQIYDVVFKINLENDTFISITIFNKKEIEEGPMSESPIYKTIQKEGIVFDY
ncbi:MAG: hypothetical protein A2Y62_01775 [Candidatus Fischerbacteria bacterium RBG_13_37_8]|uniref:Polymerase nucleotidyl transferase domain-containing protein n=1 Tax=Candidatus Fischerbacteria bacterium RBG_13_37_8 TaxID=1817863 RepID=A0A1F5VDR7_9BACT|nr:MAG: hypothetical protein A2Y62_01775 [Candidatus Fischerbacteria bacterium RBG_13_37_8]